MIEQLRNVPVRKLIRAGEWLFTFTMAEKRYPQALSDKFLQPPTGTKKLSGVLA